jgi:hypothetical protein
MAAAYSIKDQGEEAFQLVLSVVNQEMLHVQLAANIANAYGLSPVFKSPVYYYCVIKSCLYREHD